MLLPSDIARLVLGYLQQEGLSSTCKEFINESTNLKEYAEYYSDDGTMPACVFSLLGKNLSTILNEYVAAKAKDMSQEIQINTPMMSSLWKKLEVTLGQIKSMQNSPAVNHQNQRVRTRNGIVNIRRRNVLSGSQSPSHGILTSPVPQVVFAIQSPHGHPQGMLGNATVSHTAQQTRASPLCGMQTQIQDGGRLLIDVSNSPVHVMVPENRLTPGPMSPARRKWECPRRRGGGASGSSGTWRANMAASSLAAEPQSEEAVAENFPQMVIQSAREKILGDRCLQEKLAENINKILSSDPSPQASKTSCSSMVLPDPSIDEILGLQGEIHMSDDAIHDILEQTESDPAFQALFDLFDYGKSKASESTEQAAVFGSGSLVESNGHGAIATDNLPKTADQSIVHKDAASAHENASTVGRAKPGHKAKNKRKTAPTISRPRKATGPTLLSACDDGTTEASLAGALDAERGDTDSVFNGDDGAAMDVDLPEITAAPSTTPTPQTTASLGIMPPPQITASPQITAPPESAAPLENQALQTVFETVRQVITTNSSTTPSTQRSTQKQETRTTTRVSKPLRTKTRPTPGGAERGQATPTGSVLSKIVPFHRTSPSAGFVSTPAAQSQLNKAPVQNGCLSYVGVSAPSSAGITHTETSIITVPTVATSLPALPTVLPSTGTLAKDAVDPSKIVSLKIIISDEQDDVCADSSLTQAVNSISEDRIPTIFLSSPAKAPPALTGTPTGQEETALAVKSLQSTEVPQPGMTLPTLQGNVQQPATQASYIIQLPLDSTNPTFGSAAATSYFLVTEPSTSDSQASNMVLSNGVSSRKVVPPTSYALATPPRSQTYGTGSTLIISSPVQPMLQNMTAPVSVMGQNNGGNVQMVSNKFVAMRKPTPAPVKQPEPVKLHPKPASKDTTASSKTGATGPPVVTNTVQLQSSDKTGQPKVAAGTSPSHRRMLCFGSSSAESPTQPRPTTPSSTRATSTPLSPPSQQTMKDSPKKAPVKPAILAANKPKRRIETVRCTDDTQTTWSATETEKSSPSQQQKKCRKDRHSKKVTDLSESGSQSASSSNAGASQSELYKSSKSRRSQSLDKEDESRRRSKEAQSTRSSSSDHRLRSSSRRDKDEKESKQESSEKASSKSREGRGEKRTSSQESPVTANKENEAKGGRKERQPSPMPASRDLSPPPVTPPTPTLQVLPTKTPTRTSPLAKQAAEMLQDIQALDPPSTPPKRPGPGCPDMPLPRTPGSSRLQEESMDCSRTPSRQRQGEDGESTPRRLLPPPTPDLPTCSPASEAGSENNINMAAHTLMILSRSAIARTGTPLKDSLRQEGAGTKTPEAPRSKKRKQPEPQVQVTQSPCPPSKKEAKQSGSSGSKKKAKKQKKLLDSFHDDFPEDLDVDKFLSSLHYDE